MILYRHADPRFPFLWEDGDQPAARWNAAGEGPVQYFSDTPDGAWAEFLRHEEIAAAEDLATVRRALWVVEVAPGEGESWAEVGLAHRTATGGLDTYARCQAEARRLRAAGATGLVAPCAALTPGGAAGLRVDGGLQSATPRDGRTIAVFGRRPDAVGWRAAFQGTPAPSLLDKVRPLAPTGHASHA
jgi:hypothetical protein